MNDFHIRETCRLCGGTYTEVLDLGETALANEVWEDPSIRQERYPLRIVSCDSCGHRQLDTAVNPERMFKAYPYVSGISATYRAYLQEYAREIKPWLSSGELLVEIGGNDGTIGGAFDGSAAIRYINVDPCDVDQVHGMRFTEYFTQAVARRIRDDCGPASVIVANHVLAHVEDLHEVAEAVRLLLVNGGQFFCEVGDGAAQLSERYGIQYAYAEHADFHDAHSFAAFWRRHGLEVYGLDRSSFQGHSMRLRIGHAGTETPFKVPATRWDNKALLASHERTRELGRLIRELNVPVYGFGASARAATLVQVMGLSSKDMAYMFDDNPRKHGKHMPGTDIQILPASELDKRRNGICVNFCPWFSDEIKQRRERFMGAWVDVC